LAGEWVVLTSDALFLGDLVELAHAWARVAAAVEAPGPGGASAPSPFPFRISGFLVLVSHALITELLPADAADGFFPSEVLFGV